MQTNPIIIHISNLLNLTQHILHKLPLFTILVTLIASPSCNFTAKNKGYIYHEKACGEMYLSDKTHYVLWQDI